MVGCDEMLDVTPPDSLLLDEAFSTPDLVEGQLFGIYANLQQTGSFGTNAKFAPDLYVSSGSVPGGGITTNDSIAIAGYYLVWNGTFNSYSEMNGQNMTPDNADAQNNWEDNYGIINRANLILANLSAVTDAAQATRISAEARFLRAVAHFELVRAYGHPYLAPGANPNSDLGIIVATSPPPTGTSGIFSAPPRPRNVVADVYAQVIADLIFARDNLDEYNDAGGLEQAFRANSLTASAMLARVYLLQGDYDAAGEEAQNVIESGVFTLLDDPIDAFLTPNSAEAIWEVQNNATDNSGANNSGLATFYNSAGNGGRGDARVSWFFPSAAGYESGDKRLSTTTGGFFYVSGPSTYCQKWNNPQSNYNIIRLAEMYLIRAECTLRGWGGSTATADEDINEIRTRANATPITGATINDVLLERLRELCFEGEEFYTMKRVGGDSYLRPGAPANTIDGVPIIDRRLLFAIPFRELELNPGLVQN